MSAPPIRALRRASRTPWGALARLRAGRLSNNRSIGVGSVRNDGTELVDEVKADAA